MPAAIRAATAILLVLITFSALAGCGGGDEDEIRDVIDGILAARENEDAEGICSRLSSAAIGGISEDECVAQIDAAFEASTSGEGEVPDYEITDVTVEGETATATVLREGEEVDLDFVNEDGEWKASEGTFTG